MITCEFLKSPDPTLIGVWELNRNVITIGHKIGEILIDDKTLCDPALCLALKDEVLLCYKSKKLHKYTVNGKIAQAAQPLKQGDVVSFCGNEFKIREFSKTEIDKDRDEEDLLKGYEAIKNDPRQKDLFEIIEMVRKDYLRLKDGPNNTNDHED